MYLLELYHLNHKLTIFGHECNSTYLAVKLILICLLENTKTPYLNKLPTNEPLNFFTTVRFMALYNICFHRLHYYVVRCSP